MTYPLYLRCVVPWDVEWFLAREWAFGYTMRWPLVRVWGACFDWSEL